MIDKEKLIQLKKMLDEGLITQEEFDLKKKQILDIDVPKVESEVATEEKPTLPEESISEQCENPDGDDTSHNTSNSEFISKREALIMKNTEYYIPKFESIDKGSGSWNWCGFFFSPMWFAYRKMYGWAVIAFLGPFLAGLVLGMILYSTSMDEAVVDVIMRVIQFAINIVFASTANGIYRKRIDKLISEMPEAEADKQTFISNNGGVSIPAMIIVTAIYIGLSIYSFT